MGYLILLYIISYILAYYITKYSFKVRGYSWNWQDVFINLIFSLFLVNLIIASFIVIGVKLKLTDKTPPKWL